MNRYPQSSLVPALLVLLACPYSPVEYNPTDTLSSSGPSSGPSGSEADSSSASDATTVEPDSSTSTGATSTSSTSTGATSTSSTSTGATATSTDETTSSGAYCLVEAIACWSLDTTEFLDGGPLHLDGTAQGVASAPGVLSSPGWSLDAASSAAASLPELGVVTVALFVAGDGAGTIVTTPHLVVELGPTLVRCAVGGASVELPRGAGWSHVACSVDDGTLTLRTFDGAPHEATTATPLAGPAEGAIVVGPVVALADELALFDRALTSAEQCLLAGPLCP